MTLDSLCCLAAALHSRGSGRLVVATCDVCLFNGSCSRFRTASDHELVAASPQDRHSRRGTPRQGPDTMALALPHRPRHDHRSRPPVVTCAKTSHAEWSQPMLELQSQADDDHGSDEQMALVISPQLASTHGWEMVGVTLHYRDQAGSHGNRLALRRPRQHTVTISLDRARSPEDVERIRQRGYERTYRLKRQQVRRELELEWLNLESKLFKMRARGCLPTYVPVLLEDPQTEIHRQIARLWQEERALAHDCITMKSMLAWCQLVELECQLDNSKLICPRWKRSLFNTVCDRLARNPYSLPTFTFQW